MEIWVSYRNPVLFCPLNDTPLYVKQPMMAGLVMSAMKKVVPIQLEHINVTLEFSEAILELQTMKVNGAHQNTGTKRIAKDLQYSGYQIFKIILIIMQQLVVMWQFGPLTIMQVRNTRILLSLVIQIHSKDDGRIIKLQQPHLDLFKITRLRTGNRLLV